MNNANAKTKWEVEESLNYFREFVLQPQISRLVINVTAQVRELLELQGEIEKRIQAISDPRKGQSALKNAER